LPGSTATFSVTATVATGYQWQFSTDGGNTWNNVANGTGGTPSAFTTAPTTPAENNNQYQCLVAGCSGNITSSAATLTVNPTSVGGTASAGTSSFCGSGSTTITLAGSTGAIQWQASPDDLTFTNIPGATSATYNTPTLTSTTWYRAVLTSGLCAPANSSTASVTINPSPVAGTASATLTNLLSGAGTTVSLTGSTGTIQWEASDDDVTFTNIPNATNVTNTTPALTNTTYYQAFVTSGI